MPDINIGSPSILSDNVFTPPVTPDPPKEKPRPAGLSDALTTEELNDPNKIMVTIADSSTPLVVLFGPPACGKTMTLVRLARYLKDHGYTVKPVASFRPSHDQNYRRMCEGFDAMIDSDQAADSTSSINFLLAAVYDASGKAIFQILEGPGEYYFNPENPTASFPAYVLSIINSSIRKLWLLFTEPDEHNRLDVPQRRQYVSRIAKLRSQMRHSDNVVLLYNKIDITPFMLSGSHINTRAAFRSMLQSYSGIGETFRNVNPITSLWRTFDVDFATFQTGNYVEAADGTFTFVPSADLYPQRLWALIRKRLHG